MTKPLSITQVADRFQLSVYTLRYYEKIGLLTVPRTPQGIRYYDSEACQAVDAIINYRHAGLPLSKIRFIFAHPNDDQELLSTLLQTKTDLQEHMDELHTAMDYLDWKIKLHSPKPTSDK